jgi:hypothetical protein
VPLVLRNTDVENRFIVVGPTYVYGIMQGEALIGRESEMRTILL